MKLLLISGDNHPHIIKDRHVKNIQAVDSSLEIVVFPQSQREDIAKNILNSDIVAGWPADMSALKDIEHLEWIHSFSAGVDKVLTPEIVNSSVLVSNSAGIHATPIAEHIIGCMLLFTRKFYRTFQSQQWKEWQRRTDLEELRDKTVLIVGLGNIGKEAARLAACFGTHVIAVDALQEEKPDFVEALYYVDELSEILPRADFVVVSAPHTKETHHLFDLEKFQKMKSSAILINISRGGLVNEKELIEALEKKIIAGAALDVTETEPLSKDSPLWEMENVIITPHHSGLSDKYMDRAIDRFCLNLQAFLKGEEIPNLIDKERGY